MVQRASGGTTVNVTSAPVAVDVRPEMGSVAESTAVPSARASTRACSDGTTSFVGFPTLGSVDAYVTRFAIERV